MRDWIIALLLAPTVALAAPPSSHIAPPAATSDDSDCMISLKAIKHPAPRFADYPVAAEPNLRPAPLVITPDIRSVRTNLRRSYDRGLIFAGHYMVAAVFAGTSGMMWVIVDARTGRVVPKARGGWWFGDLDDDAFKGFDVRQGYPGIRFRRDSRLVIFLGRSDGGDDPEGVTYYEWVGDHLKRILFVPKAESCVQRSIDQ